MDAWNTLDTKLDFARRGILIRCADPSSRLPPAQPPHSQQDSRIPSPWRRILIPSSPADRIVLTLALRIFPFNFPCSVFVFAFIWGSAAFLASALKPATIFLR